MEIKKENLFKKAFAVSLLFTVIGSLLKINHIEGANIVLMVSLIATLVFVIIGIYEVNSSNKIDFTEKIIWTLCFIFFNLLTAITYLLFGRNRIV